MSLGVLDCRGGFQLLAAIRETVGRDVHDAHDARSIHRNAGDGFARGYETIKQVLDSRLVNGLDGADAGNRVLDVARLALPEANGRKCYGTASQGQGGFDRNSVARHLAIEQSDRLEIETGHRDFTATGRKQIYS